MCIRDSIPPAPRGVPQIEVTFDIDANGILNVNAKDKGTGKKQSITITASSGLSDSDIDQMVQDAAAHEEEDKARKDSIEARNQLDSLVHEREKFAEEYGDKIDDADKMQLEEAFADAKKLLAESDAPAEAAPYKEKFDAIMALLSSIGQKMYQNSVESEASTEDLGEDEAAAEEEVVDAEFEDEEE